MMITKKAINDDIAFIVATLKHKEVTIPSFFSCAAPGLSVMLGMILWQGFVAYPLTYHDKMSKLFAQGSIGFSFFLGFIIFFVLTNMQGKYLALPSDIREQSLVVKLVKRKSMIYAGIWIAVNVFAGVLIKILAFPVMISCGMQLVSLVFIFLISTVDLGRYDLAVFSSVIKAWRDGDKLDPEQLERLDI
ncbi:hypothetical protein A7D02_17670 (plasmid) [Aeromonas salmonicida]|uniref:conjugal transfer entry exclusion protein TraS n=1 Tax=Aeromonas salmonicida TaxID=645 RepID=UPI000A0F6E77|nr:conjugal transfer entry exclusion protein TraS [Aeromonas salmonicida]ORJ11072.1 hypothetical protein A7D02_17670 [Aeromonas salmonicida]